MSYHPQHFVMISHAGEIQIINTVHPMLIGNLTVAGQVAAPSGAMSPPDSPRLVTRASIRVLPIAQVHVPGTKKLVMRHFVFTGE